MPSAPAPAVIWGLMRVLMAVPSLRYVWPAPRVCQRAPACRFGKATAGLWRHWEAHLSLLTLRELRGLHLAFSAEILTPPGTPVTPGEDPSPSSV